MNDRLRVKLEIEWRDDLSVDRQWVPWDADEHTIVRVGDARRDPEVVKSNLSKADLRRLDRPETRDRHGAV